jgi:predicted DsbA family dithiol-disulfide isomerase
MPRLIVAHDYICPWCYVGWEQGKKLKAEFPDLQLIWKGYELLPEGMDYTPAPPNPEEAKKPPIPSRFELLAAADRIVMPERTHPFSRSRRALEGAEFALAAGKADTYHDAVYHTYWREDRDISDLAVLTEVAEQIGLDVNGFLMAVESGRYRDRIIEFDNPAHEAGVWNVPTWMFPEKWIAEQPYSVVREYIARFVNPKYHESAATS